MPSVVKQLNTGDLSLIDSRLDCCSEAFEEPETCSAHRLTQCGKV